MLIELVMSTNHLILCCPLLLPPSIFPSIRVFSNESTLHISWQKHWSFSFSPSNEYSRLISFRMDLLDLLIVQRTLKSFLQHHSSKASVLQHPAFLMVQLSHPYMTTGKTIALTMWNIVGKGTFLFFRSKLAWYLASDINTMTMTILQNFENLIILRLKTISGMSLVERNVYIIIDYLLVWILYK